MQSVFYYREFRRNPYAIKNSCPLCFIRKGRSKSCGTTFFHRRLASSVSVSISVSSSPDEQNIILRYDNVYLLRHSLLDLFGVKLQEVFITNGPCASHHPAAFCLNVMSVITYSFHRWCLICCLSYSICPILSRLCPPSFLSIFRSSVSSCPQTTFPYPIAIYLSNLFLVPL